MFPSAVVYQNTCGGKTITFTGTPNAPMTYLEGFAFLNESRRESLIHLLSSELPLYYDGCEEVYLKGAYTSDGKLFCAIFNFGYDPIEKISLVIPKTIEKVEILAPDGTYQTFTFLETQNRITISHTAYPLDPVILFLTPTSDNKI